MVGVVTHCAILSSSVLDKNILNEMVYSHLWLHDLQRSTSDYCQAIYPFSIKQYSAPVAHKAHIKHASSRSLQVTLPCIPR